MDITKFCAGSGRRVAIKLLHLDFVFYKSVGICDTVFTKLLYSTEQEMPHNARFFLVFMLARLVCKPSSNIISGNIIAVATQ